MPIEIEGPEPRTFRCAWTNAPLNDRTCDQTIPADVVAAEWERTAGAGQHTRAGTYFECWHEGERWRVYDLGDGVVGRVYCPVHLSAVFR
jgi:hypothetical protein